MSSESAITVRNLTKEYGTGDDAVRALNGVSFDVEPGTAVGVLGPNGAGKTTMIKSMLSLMIPTGGEVRLSGTDVSENPRAVHDNIGVMLEGARNVYWRLTVRENIHFFARLANQKVSEQRDRYETLLEEFDLAEKADTTVRELSRGQKQKVALICALARGGDVLFLDEPTLGLDVESTLELRSELRNLVEQEGNTILLTSHDMDVVQNICDRVIILNDGEIIADDPVEALLDDFSTQTYEFTLENETPGDARDRLRSVEGDGVTVDSIDQTPTGSRVRLHVTDPDFFELVEALKAADLSVDTFNTIEPGLEDVFLEITDTTAEASVAEPAQTR